MALRRLSYFVSADYADNLPFQIFRIVAAEVEPDWISAFEEFAHKLLIDHRSKLLALHVRCLEDAPIHQRDLHGLEVLRTDGEHLRFDGVLVCLPFDEYT